MNGEERFRRLMATTRVRRDLGARSVRAAAMTAAAGFTDFAVRIGSTAILARLVLPEHFGLIMMVTAVTAVADQLRELGLSSATVQHPGITHAQVTNLFWINLTVGAALAALVCAASPFIAAYYHEPRLTPIACLLSLTLLCGGFTVQHQALLTRQLRLGRCATVRLGSSVLSTLLAIALAFAGFGYWALLWREIARAALLAAGMWLSLPWIPSGPQWRVDVRGLLRFGAHLTTANILGTIVAGADRFLLGRFWGAAPVAMYRQAYQLITAPTDQLLSPLYQVAQPSLSLLQDDAARYRLFYGKILSAIGFIIMPLSLYVAVYSREMTAVLLGQRWIECAPILAVLSGSTFIKQAVGSALQIPITRGRSDVYLGLMLLQNVTLVGCMLFGVRWGTLGIAAAELTTTYVLIAPKLHFCLRGSPVTLGLFSSAIVRPAIASIAMGLVLLGVRQAFPPASVTVTLALGAGAGAAVLLGVWQLLPGGRAELRHWIGDIRAAFPSSRTPARAEAPVAVGR